MALAGSAFANITATLTKTLALAPTTSNLTDNGKNGAIFRDGIGLNQVNEMFHDERTLGDGVSEELDLAGVLLNPLGDIINFTSIKAIGIYSADTTNLARLEIGGAAANTFIFLKAADDIVVVGPQAGSTFLLIDPSAGGITVTAGSADKLKIKHDGSDVQPFKYRIVLLGTKA